MRGMKRTKTYLRILFVLERSGNHLRCLSIEKKNDQLTLLDYLTVKETHGLQ